MSVSRRVALVGFSAFEREMLEACFRLAGARTPVYTVTPTAEQCDLIIADADQTSAVHAVSSLGRLHDTLFIGATRTPGAPAGRLPRPIDALQVQRALDAIVQRRAERAQDAGRHRSERRNARPSGRALQQAQEHIGLEDFHSSSGFSNSVLIEGDLKLDTVLVVSDSRAEQRMLRELLGKLGYSTEAVRNGEEALQHCQANYRRFVFLGVGMTGLDAFQTCRRLKQCAYLWLMVPTVVIMASQPSAIDRIRATFAGCDAYLGQPLLDDELMHLLTTHDATFERGFEPTAPQAI
ncbi:MAG: PleD family two-component system response regulator [Leptothrix sp. (in: b-proteobacteria)]